MARTCVRRRGDRRNTRAPPRNRVVGGVADRGGSQWTFFKIMQSPYQLIVGEVTFFKSCNFWRSGRKTVFHCPPGGSGRLSYFTHYNSKTSLLQKLSQFTQVPPCAAHCLHNGVRNCNIKHARKIKLAQQKVASSSSHLTPRPLGCVHHVEMAQQEATGTLPSLVFPIKYLFGCSLRTCRRTDAISLTVCVMLLGSG